jgi:ribosomal protein S18 acetylase RimI-like enzyme
MRRIESYEQIQSLTAGIRSLRKGFTTNFFWNPVRHSCWVENGELFYDESNECILLLHPEKDFDYLFYLATGPEKVASTLGRFKPERVAVFDYLFKGDCPTETLKAFRESGYEVYRKLYRMSRTGLFPVDAGEVSPEVQMGKEEDLPVVEALFERDFDPLCEQIPSREELQSFVRGQQLLVLREKDILAGFLVYEMTGKTWYLRYWYTDPAHRNQGVGSKLLRAAVALGGDSTRQILWVLSDNENAIKRYGHFGFTREPMNDYILIKRPNYER